jgi:hypothetical protein
MIASQDRSFWVGASDTDRVMGKWDTNSFTEWWLRKIGINTDSFSNKYTSAGTHYEHKILHSLGIPMELDKQIIIEPIRLRVNLDGNTDTCIYECKTYKLDNGFTMPQKYLRQVQVQMFASGLRKAKIIVYGLKEEEYDNYFLPIDPDRVMVFDVNYDETWIEEWYLPNLRYISQCLKEGRYPDEGHRKDCGRKHRLCYGQTYSYS